MAQAKLEDSNIANYGSKEHKDLKLKAAQSEPAWAGAGKAVGTEVWRVEKMKMVKKPKEEHGKFFSGDSYIILNTYKQAESDKLLYNVHFWLGEKTSQDEMGIAAYKTVELDDLLGDLPVQYREVQGYESKEFLAIFAGNITIMEGGMDSGFRNVKPEEYKPRLLHLKGKQNVRVTEVKLDWHSLNVGDVFLLDAGLKLFQWNGKSAGIFEKRKANEIILNIKKERNGRPVSVVLDDLEDNEEFWSKIGGKPAAGSLAAATSDDIKEAKTLVLLEVSDKTGELKRTEIARGSARKNQLNTNEVFLLDINHTVYCWIGKGASPAERANGIKFGVDYLKELRRPDHTPVVRVLEGAEPRGFLAELS